MRTGTHNGEGSFTIERGPTKHPLLLFTYGCENGDPSPPVTIVEMGTGNGFVTLGSVLFDSAAVGGCMLLGKPIFGRLSFTVWCGILPNRCGRSRGLLGRQQYQSHPPRPQRQPLGWTAGEMVLGIFCLTVSNDTVDLLGCCPFVERAPT